jgi:hypothetical protein
MVAWFRELYHLVDGRPGRSCNQVGPPDFCTRKGPFLQPEMAFEAWGGVGAVAGAGAERAGDARARGDLAATTRRPAPRASRSRRARSEPIDTAGAAVRDCLGAPRSGAEPSWQTDRSSSDGSGSRARAVSRSDNEDDPASGERPFGRVYRRVSRRARREAPASRSPRGLASDPVGFADPRRSCSARVGRRRRGGRGGPPTGRLHRARLAPIDAARVPLATCRRDPRPRPAHLFEESSNRPARRRPDGAAGAIRRDRIRTAATTARPSHGDPVPDVPSDPPEPPRRVTSEPTL